MQLLDKSKRTPGKKKGTIDRRGERSVCTGRRRMTLSCAGYSGFHSLGRPTQMS